MDSDVNMEKRFNDLLPEIRIIISRRRHSWTLSTLPWEDVESILMTRIYQKLHLYDSDKPFENWANRLISNTLSNMLRDLLYKHEKPCITANPAGGECAFNMGGDRCGWTSNGIQCAECPLYARWMAKKQVARNINASLPLDAHSQEVQNMQQDFFNVEESKPLVDKYVMERLNPHEASIYRMLFIENMSIDEVSKRFKYKTHNDNRVSQVLRKLVLKFKVIAREGLQNGDII